MKRIRALRIITRYIKGGADRNVCHSINALLKTGRYEIDLIAGRDSDRDFLKQFNNVRIHLLDSLVRDISPMNDLKALWQIYRIVKRNRYRIVHTHTAKAGFLGRIAAQKANAPCVIHGVHGVTFHSNLPWMRNQLYTALERWAGRRTDCFVSVGEELTQVYLEAGVGRPEQYRLIRSGMELERFLEAGQNRAQIRSEMRRHLGFQDNHIVIGLVGRLEPPKGCHAFLDAAAKLSQTRPNARFLIAGDGSLRGQLQERARRNGLNNTVRFAGYRNDIHHVMASLDALAICSTIEGLPQVAVQAAAVGIPIAAFRAVGVSEVVKDGVNGYTVDIGDTEALTERLSEFAADLETAQQMGLKGRQIVGGEWTIACQQAKTVELYEEMERRFLAADDA